MSKMHLLILCLMAATAQNGRADTLEQICDFSSVTATTTSLVYRNFSGRDTNFDSNYCSIGYARSSAEDDARSAGYSNCSLISSRDTGGEIHIFATCRASLRCSRPEQLSQREIRRNVCAQVSLCQDALAVVRPPNLDLTNYAESVRRNYGCRSRR